MIIYFQYLGIFLGVILFMFLLGEIIFRFFLKTKNGLDTETIFYKITFGVIAFTLITAVFFSLSKTILIFVIPIIICLVFKSEKSKNHSIINSNPTNYKYLSFIPLFALLIFTFSFICCYDSSGFLATPHPDYIFYARLSKNLIGFGIENTSIDITSPTAGVAPYHYFELWLNGGISAILHSNYLQTLMLVTFPTLIFMVWLGMCVLIQTILQKQETKHFFIAFLGLFLCGLMLPLYSKIPFFENLGVFARNVWNYQKLNIIYLILLHFLILWFKGNKNAAVVSLLFLPVFFVSTAPAIFLSIGLFLIINVLFYDKNRKNFVELMLLSVFVALGIISFYYFFSGQIMLNTPIKSIPFVESLKTRRNIIAGTAIQLSVVFIPFFIFIFKLRKQLLAFLKSNNLYLIVIFLFVLSLISWAVFYTLVDSVQFFSNISIPLINIGLVVLFSILLENRMWGQSVVFFAFICVNFFNTWQEMKPKKSDSIQNLITLKSKLENKNHLSVSLSNPTDFTSIFSKNTIFSYPGQYLSNFYNDAYTVNMSVHQIPIDSASMHAGMEIKLVQNAPFYKFVEIQKSEKTFKNIESSQLDFIKKYKIDYMIINKGVEIPIYIKNIAKEEFIHQNHKFIFLK